jgi:hypothetical protein
MTIKPSIKSALWMLPGALLMLLFVLAALHFRDSQSPSDQLAFKARRADLVSRIQLALASASEAENHAVMASTNDSKTFAEQARVATEEGEREYRELEGISRTGGTPRERDLLVQFAQAFAEFQRIENQLLPLAVKNTNLTAYGLAFGPAAEALDDMNRALSRLIAANAHSRRAAMITALAFRAQSGASRVETLLAPHIAEERDDKMDEMEALMGKQDAQVRGALDDLKALPMLSHDTDLATAIASYARFGQIKTNILTLSRENTNVRSLAIAIHQERKVTLLCQDSLDAVKQAILDEPVRGVTYQQPVRPR